MSHSFKDAYLGFVRATRCQVRIRSILRVLTVVALVAVFMPLSQPVQHWPAPPSTGQLHLDTLTLSEVGPKRLATAAERLLDAAHAIADQTYVPYAFGGRVIGSPKVCEACRACIETHSLDPESSLTRLNKCSSCQKCGIDCTHLIERIFAKADLPYNFAPTAVFKEVSTPELRSDYGLIDIEPKFEELKAGDLVLEDKHIMLVLAVDQVLETMDVVHAARGGSIVDPKRDPGGIRRLKGITSAQFASRTLRVMRHEQLDPSNHVPHKPTPSVSIAQWLTMRSKIVLAIGNRS